MAADISVRALVPKQLLFTLRERSAGQPAANLTNVITCTLYLRYRGTGLPVTTIQRDCAFEDRANGKVSYTTTATDYVTLVAGTDWDLWFVCLPAPTNSTGVYPDDTTYVLHVNL
jgi:hypothetical protein